MTIRIVTRHPALQYVLRRTAPVGTYVRFAEIHSRSPSAFVHTIHIVLDQLSGRDLRGVLETWLPTHIRQYGADRFEIDGRAVSPEPGDLRCALATRFLRQRESSAA